MDFADLHNVRPGKIDFSGVIKRLKEKDNPMKHLNKEYIEFIKQQIYERKKFKNPEVHQVLK